jgi:hypothetical protein
MVLGYCLIRQIAVPLLASNGKANEQGYEYRRYRILPCQLRLVKPPASGSKNKEL